MYESLNQESTPLPHTPSQRPLLLLLLSNRKERAEKACIILFRECFHALITSLLHLKGLFEFWNDMIINVEGGVHAF